MMKMGTLGSDVVVRSLVTVCQSPEILTSSGKSFRTNVDSGLNAGSRWFDRRGTGV